MYSVFKSYHIILYSNINKLFTLSITGVSKGTQKESRNGYFRTATSIFLCA